MSKVLTEQELRSMSFHELCGTLDCGWVDRHGRWSPEHPQQRRIEREIELRRRANPRQRHYAEAMA